MMHCWTWDYAMRLANAFARDTGVRQQVRKSRTGGWLVSPVIKPRKAQP